MVLLLSVTEYSLVNIPCNQHIFQVNFQVTHYHVIVLFSILFSDMELVNKVKIWT